MFGLMGEDVTVELTRGRQGRAIIGAVSGPPGSETVEVRGSGLPPF
jgi:hypothetical protein